MRAMLELTGPKAGSANSKFGKGNSMCQPAWKCGIRCGRSVSGFSQTSASKPDSSSTQIPSLLFPENIDISRPPVFDSSNTLVCVHSATIAGKATLAACKIFEDKGYVVVQSRGKGYFTAIKALATMNIIQGKRDCWFDVLLFMDDAILYNDRPIGNSFMNFAVVLKDSPLPAGFKTPRDCFVFPEHCEVTPDMDPVSMKTLLCDCFEAADCAVLDCIGSASVFACLRGIAYTRGWFLREGVDICIIPSFDGFAEVGSKKESSTLQIFCQKRSQFTSFRNAS